MIVLGVFVALAGESWWSDREERAFERELRQDMVEEFAGNIAILESDLNANATAAAYMEGLTLLSDAELVALSDDELNREYGGFIGWDAFDPEMGIVQALVESGNLGVIADRELRLRLSRWAGLLAEKQRYTLQGTDFQIIALMPVLAEVSADRIWSAAERRRVQSLLNTSHSLQALIIANQQRLLAEAQAIVAYLNGGESDQQHLSD